MQFDRSKKCHVTFLLPNIMAVCQHPHSPGMISEVVQDDRGAPVAEAIVKPVGQAASNGRDSGTSPLDLVAITRSHGRFNLREHKP